MDLDPGVGEFKVYSKGSSDIFVQKLDSNGNFVWGKSFGGTNVDIANSIVQDYDGNVYVVGAFQGSIHFSTNSPVSYWTSNGSYDIFILKLDSNGNFLGSRAYGGIGEDIGVDVVSNDKGDLYLTGTYSGTVNFTPGAPINVLNPNGQEDVFLLRLSNMLNLYWVSSVGGVSEDRISSIALDTAGNIYRVGLFQDTVDFDPRNTNIYNLISNGFFDVFVQKLDSNGRLIWTRSFGGKNGETGSDIEVDLLGNIFVTGRFTDTVDFDPGLNTFSLFAQGGGGNSEAYVLKLKPDGTFSWAKSFGGTNFEEGHAIDADANGNIYICGEFWGTSDFDPSVNTYSLTSNGLRESFLLKLDSIGAFRWAQSIGGTGRDAAISITVNIQDDLFISGYFENTVDFNPASAINNHSSVGGFDMFILKLSQGVLTDLNFENHSGFNENILLLYPNPASNELRINTDKPVRSISVSDINGKAVKINRSNNTIDVSNLSSGLYFIQVETEKGILREKFVKE